MLNGFTETREISPWSGAIDTETMRLTLDKYLPS